jgi:hypothetical protein
LKLQNFIVVYDVEKITNEIYLIGYVNWNYILFLNNFNNITLYWSEFYFLKNKVGTQNNKKNLLGNELLDSEFIKLVIWLVFCHELDNFFITK